MKKFGWMCWVLLVISTCAYAQDKDLSQIDWDDNQTVETKEQDLANVDWDEDSQPADDDAMGDWDDGDEEDDDDAFTEELMKEMEAKEAATKVIHFQGVLLFFFYLLGGGFTAYWSRNRAVTYKMAPELLILLHTFWPIELLLLVMKPGKAT